MGEMEKNKGRMGEVRRKIEEELRKYGKKRGKNRVRMREE